MPPINENDDVSQDDPSPAVVRRLVAYDEAKAGRNGDVGSAGIESPLSSELACVDLLHRVWPNFEPPASSRDGLPPPKILGDFRLIREIGRGGMGTVFEAEQISMGRRVALKVLPFAALVQDKSLQRFRNEVRAAAALDHRHIVAVYSIGEERGVHFYAMQLIRGQTLADTITQLRNTEQVKSWRTDTPIEHSFLTTGGGEAGRRVAENPPTIDSAAGASSSTNREEQARVTTAGKSRQAAEFYRTAARLGIQAAEALQHAHEAGVLHRDIKPSNLMLDAEGQLYITDFGLARIESEIGLTMTGDLLGTLRYMSPEQALGNREFVDHRSDIYSLGATLYELLTLQPIYAGSDRAELLRQIAFQEPRRLRQINRNIPVDLETIVAKAIEKNPADRYQSAQMLANDLRAYREDRPIQAKPPTILNRITKWSRRHQTLVLTAGLALVLLTVILAVGMAFVKRAQTQAIAALRETSDLLYTADMAVAYQTFEKGWSDEVQPILDRHRPTGREPDRRGLEWHLLQKLVQPPASFTLAGHEGSVNELAVFPDRRRLASVGKDGTLRIWDVRARKLVRKIKICDQELYSVAISPDGRFVVTGSKVLYLCDLEQADRVTEHFRAGHDIDSLAFSADGKHLVAGSRYHEVCLLSMEGQIEKRIPCDSRVESLEFVVGGSSLLVPNRRPLPDQKQLGMVELWSAGLSSIEQELKGSGRDWPENISIARSSPCGKYVAAGARRDAIAFIFDRASGRILDKTPISRDWLTDLAYAPDGNAIAIGYRNGRVEYFELRPDAEGKPSIDRRPLVVNAHKGEVMSVRFLDANTLATCGTDGLVRIWDVPTGAGHAFDFSDFGMGGMDLSPDGSLLLYVCKHEYLVANMDSGEVISRHSDPEAIYFEPAWSPTGDRMAVCDGHSEAVVVLSRSGQTICSISHGVRPEAVAFSPDGSLVAIVGNQQLQLCSCDNGQEVFRQSLKHPGTTIAFSHDGARLAYGEQFGPVTVFNVTGRQPLRELVCGSDTDCVAFSPDDSLLATGHDDSTIRLWDVETGRLRAELVGHHRANFNLVFSADGHTLLSSANDGTIRLWSVDHGRGYGVAYHRFEPESKNAQCRVSLSSDGRRLAVGYGTQRKDSADVLLWQIDPSTRN